MFPNLAVDFFRIFFVVVWPKVVVRCLFAAPGRRPRCIHWLIWGTCLDPFMVVTLLPLLLTARIFKPHQAPLVTSVWAPVLAECARRSLPQQSTEHC